MLSSALRHRRFSFVLFLVYFLVSTSAISPPQDFPKKCMATRKTGRYDLIAKYFDASPALSNSLSSCKKKDFADIKSVVFSCRLPSDQEAAVLELNAMDGVLAAEDAPVYSASMMEGRAGDGDVEATKRRLDIFYDTPLGQNPDFPHDCPISCGTDTQPHDPWYDPGTGLGMQESGLFPEMAAQVPPAEMIIIASLDTGADYTHEDLRDTVWRNMLDIPGDGIDNEG